MRCSFCESGRRDGQPCDDATCLCRCHRQGRAAVDALLDTGLDKARAARKDAKTVYKTLSTEAGEIRVEMREAE